jgi:hypothetical protein
MHIDNLYKSRDILEFKSCYAMEKIHGSSAHVSWKTRSEPNGATTEELNFSPGGIDHDTFERLFDKDKLKESFRHLGHSDVVIYGEVYGGKIQKMRETYGAAIKFVAFEVKIGNLWLCVPDAEKVANSLSFDFVSYALIPTTLEAIDAERDKPSIQAIKNGVGLDRKREGIVLRPPIEVIKNNGSRIIAKHKREDFQETKTPRPLSKDKFEVLQKANEIADEWVTDMRLTHVLDSFPSAGIEQTGAIIGAMVDDVCREAGDEIVMSKEAKTAIARKTALMFKTRLKESLK